VRRQKFDFVFEIYFLTSPDVILSSVELICHLASKKNFNLATRFKEMLKLRTNVIPTIPFVKGDEPDTGRGKRVSFGMLVFSWPKKFELWVNFFG
jgi:hypothetical protein